ncbi:MAG: NAD-dependent epimerase/dehydratase family protein [Planctomycetota bacterium]
MKALVTGGGGFLGRHLVKALRERGDEVVSYSRGRYPELEARGVACAEGDLVDRDALARACAGAEVVFHVAAKAGIWGDAGEYWRTNVEGTESVLEACRIAGVKRLVFTSSPSVCFDGGDHRMAGNDLPYATRFLAEYPRTKMEAEKLVLAANGKDGLATVALRPHLIVGPDDPHLLPRLVARAKAGKLAIVGDGRNEVSLTWVENAVEAHLAAADRLEARAPHAGKAYFIAQKEPVALWKWIGDVLERLGAPRPTRRVPLGVAYTAGAALEAWWRLTRRTGEPRMTRFLALELARSHSYDLRPAERDFGYRERVSMPVATESLVTSYSNRSPRP